MSTTYPVPPGTSPLDFVVQRMKAIKPEYDRLANYPGKLSVSQRARYAELTTEWDELEERRAELEEATRRAEAAAAVYDTDRRRPMRAAGNPLAFTTQALDRLQAALDTRTAARIRGGDTEERATLQTGTYGSVREWGANVLAGPRLLHVAAGVPIQRVDAAFGSHPVLTLPTASAAVGETVTLGEYAASTAGAVTLARYGRWTDVSRESTLGTDADTLVSMHQVGVALDLDKVLIDATETAAGAAVAFAADVPGAIRKAMATVIAATAAPDASDLVVLVNPANADLLQDVTPIGGATIAEGFQRFSGALVYPSLAVNTGFMTVANLRAGARYFEAQSFMTETDVLIKTAVVTVASSVIAGYGVTLAGHAVMVDVVTP